MRRKLITAGAILLLASAAHRAQGASVLGDWQDPTGSIIHIDHCGTDLCLWIVSLSPSAPATTDIHNPEPNERGRALCGLRIGSGFNLRDAGHAVGGTLYDPKTGKTYHGSMTVDGTAAGEKLDLRGYVGIPLFGASQTWTRPTKTVDACKTGNRADSSSHQRTPDCEGPTCEGA
jgi:uncharacterized protein (DUF2147 family)